MKSHTTITKLLRLSAVLFVGTALTTAAGNAHEKGDHGQNTEHHVAIAKERKENNKQKDKESNRERRERNKQVNCKRKNCEKPGDDKNTVTITAGTGTYKIPMDPKDFSVAVAGPNSITVRSGAYSVTVPAKTIVVHGDTTSVFAAEKAGFTLVDLPNGDHAFTITSPPLVGR
jgi:hypothetical protein